MTGLAVTYAGMGLFAAATGRFFGTVNTSPYTFLFVGRWTALLDRRIVIMEKGPNGEIAYEKIRPTKTGNYTFFFNKWIKLPVVPTFQAEG